MKLIIYLAIAAVIAVATVAAVRSGSTTPVPPSSVPTVGVVDRTVVLEVVGDPRQAGENGWPDSAADVMVTWDDGGAVSQDTVALPWTTPADMPASLTAQNQGDSGTITCRILQGTTVLQESTASNPYGVCSVAWDG